MPPSEVVGIGPKMSVKTRSSFEDFLFSIFRDTGCRRDLEILQTSQQQSLPNALCFKLNPET